MGHLNAQTIAGAKSWSGSAIFNSGISATGGSISLNDNALTNTVSIGGGNTTGSVTIGGTSAKVISIGTGAAANAISVGSANGTTLISGSITLNGGLNYGRSTNVNDAYSVTLSPAPTSYVAGMIILLDPNVDNSGACSINVNALGAKSIMKGGSNPGNKNIKSNGICLLVYDGTVFQLIGQ